jgi:hypothetical protein
MAKVISLTQGKVALVDDDVFPILNQYKWHFSQGYASRMTRHNGKRLVIKMHHEILPARTDIDVDHVNGNTLDNRRANLRYATRSQNNANRHARSKGTSPYKGVCWRPIPKRWKAYIKKDRRQIHLGYFSTQEAAARAYNDAALRLFGAFARLNDVK